jgi:hypothetical protein
MAARSLQISRAYLHRLIRPNGPSLVDDEMLRAQEQPQQLGTV